MSIVAALRRVGHELHADVEDAGGHVALEMTLAKRDTPAALRHLRYRIQLDVEEDEKTVYFTESLWERGVAAKGAIDLAPRLAGKEETFRVEEVPSGTGDLELQSRLFEKRYQVRLDLAPVRRRLKAACASEGYDLRHLVQV